jgi:hypothetical protein
MSRKGYAQATVNDELQRSVSESVGELLANNIQVGKLNRGVLQLYATDSVAMQELIFQKRKILAGIQTKMPQTKITDLKFKVQTK